MEEISLATVTWEMSRRPTEEQTYLSLEEIELELEEIGRYATCSTYCGSVISILWCDCLNEKIMIYVGAYWS